MTDTKTEPTSMDEWRETNRLEGESLRQEMRLREEAAKRAEEQHAAYLAELAHIQRCREEQTELMRRQVVEFARIADAIEAGVTRRP